ncbi:MAG TPA: phosphoglucosamine mutase [Candidatus Tyrphobacter sp.]
MRIFGTDGVRGVANSELTPELAFRIGRAGASVLARSSERHRPVIVGRDTRLSGTMLEAAIVAGITSVGRDAVSIGIVPTPAVACVTVAERAAAGVMISASHNPIEDNGIKFFGADGLKLPDAAEEEIEALLDDPDLPRPTGTGIGVARLAQNLVRHYYRLLERTGADLRGLHLVVDAAFGSAYAIAPYMLRKLGATVVELHCENDGARINVECGATDLRALRERVVALVDTGQRAIGVAFDGDADRALFIDERGEFVSGDHVLYAIGRDLHERGELTGNAIVGTVMTNIGAERALARHGITLLRAPVGDRYVLEMMREGGYVLGGEQSGHVIDLLRNTTGDGPMTAVLLLGIVARQGSSLHELVQEVVVAPQVLVNVRTRRRDLLEAPAVQETIRRAEAALDGSGRLLIRLSGTEPLVRIMAEGDDRLRIERLAAEVADALGKEIARLGET